MELYFRTFSMIYWVHGDIYKNEPLAFLIEDSQIKEQIEPYFMARIVDVKRIPSTVSVCWNS